MLTAKVIANGGSQAVRIPKAYRFDGDEVYVNRIGGVVCLMEKGADRAEIMAQALELFTDDFMQDVDPLPAQERELFA